MSARRFALVSLLLAAVVALVFWSQRPRTDDIAPSAGASDDASNVTEPLPIEEARPDVATDAALPSEALPLSQRLPALEALARAGHPEAGCRLAVERLRCARLRRWQADGHDLDREARLEAEGKLEQANEVASQSLMRLQQKSECEAAGALGDADALTLLAPAAAAGHGPAAVLYFEAGRGMRSQRGIYQHPGFDAWRRNAARQLQAALDAGVPEAARSLLMAYWMDGDFASGLVPDDPQRAWFHLVLASELFGSSIHPDTAANLALPDAAVRERIAAEARAFRRERFGEAVYEARPLDPAGIHRQPGLTASDFCREPRRR